jgi:hypothetical protein
METDYVLGTDDGEIARLALQHQVWRPRVLRAWRLLAHDAAVA